MNQDMPDLPSKHVVFGATCHGTFTDDGVWKPMKRAQVTNCGELIACLRQWRDSTPDAWILLAADNLERLERELSASQLHARTLNSILGTTETQRDRVIKLLSVLLASAHRNERDYMPAEWHEAVDDAKAFLKEVAP